MRIVPKRFYTITETKISSVMEEELDDIEMPESHFGNEPFGVQYIISGEEDEHQNPITFESKIILN